jgi:tRNA(Ile)-lysidine synthase
MALLYLLAAVQTHLQLTVYAAWVDHGLRPSETPQERETVARAATQLGLPFFERAVDTTGCAAVSHLSIEHAARKVRYAALREVCHETGADCIAVAHTADDQAEEVLLRLLRGSGRKGVSGMQIRNGDVIRPLLETEKKDILAWLDRRNIAYCIDSSNTDVKYTRNRVRLLLLPFLRENFDQNISKSLRKTAATLTVDEDLLKQLTESAYGDVVSVTGAGEEKKLRLARAAFTSLHPALQRRVAEQLLWQLDSRAGFDHILVILDTAGHGKTHTERHLSHGLRLGVFREFLEFSYPAGKAPWRGRLFA